MVISDKYWQSFETRKGGDSSISKISPAAMGNYEGG